jgi:hypothetical protein
MYVGSGTGCYDTSLADLALENWQFNMMLPSTQEISIHGSNFF